MAVIRQRGDLRAVIAAVAFAASASCIAGCSRLADSSYPAVHEMPAPRAEAPMNPAEVSRATADLVLERNTLNAEAQGHPPAAADITSTGSTATATKKSGKSAAKKAGTATVAPQPSGGPTNP